MPQSLREALPDLTRELDALVSLRSAHPSDDGSERLLVDLAAHHLPGHAVIAAPEHAVLAPADAQPAAAAAGAGAEPHQQPV